MAAHAIAVFERAQANSAPLNRRAVPTAVLVFEPVAAAHVTAPTVGTVAHRDPARLEVGPDRDRSERAADGVNGPGIRRRRAP